MADEKSDNRIKRAAKRIPPIGRLIEQRDELAAQCAALNGERDRLLEALSPGMSVRRVPEPTEALPAADVFGASNILHVRYPRSSIGRWTYGGLVVHAWDEGEPLTFLTVGSFCSIAAGVQVFLGGEHRSEWVSTFPFNMWDGGKPYSAPPKSKGDVVIGSDVWIGTEAMIMSGVTIGDGAVIGARSLVTSDVEPYAIVAGNPARFIKKRFSDEIIARLLGVKWWDWPDEEIAAVLHLMMQPDIVAFLDQAEAHLSER
jgi:acetyltransferase-like isoleucine patch superfamily enzyme